MNQRFEDDQAELDAHFAERVQAYLELGETPEQALVSAHEKFGETELVVQELRRQHVQRHPLTIGALAAVCWLVCASILQLLTSPLVPPVLNERQPFPFGGTEVLLLLTRVYLTLVPSALLVTFNAVGRFPRHARSIVLGILLCSLLQALCTERLSWLLMLLPTLQGALLGWRLAYRRRLTRTALRL